MSTPLSERKLLLLVGAVQFVNILDFMMIMPLGPDFARALAIPNAKLGLVTGSYTGAAAIAGLAASTFLDRFERRKALGTALLGLVLATAAGGLAVGLHTMLAARVIAGLFGGPATAISLSIVADAIPPERRGKALGAVMGSFAVASVLGVPIGLELAEWGGWRMPFFSVAGVGLVICWAAISMMPQMRHHLQHLGQAKTPVVEFLSRRAVYVSLAATATVMVANFALIPNLSAFFQFNAGYPRAHLSRLYAIGGLLSFVMLRLAGAMVDRIGAAWVALMATVFYVVSLYLGFAANAAPLLPVMVIFVTFMVTSSFRAVPMTTLSSRVPGPGERARFLSFQSAVQHMSAATGSILSTHMLIELPGGRLEGVGRVALFSIGIGLLLPPLLRIVEGDVRKQEAETLASTARAAGAVEPGNGPGPGPGPGA